MFFGLGMIRRFYTNKKFFYIQAIVMSLICLVIQTIQITSNDFSASYFTSNDEYWTMYYKKPFPHFHSYNIGLVVGCNMFTWKYQTESQGVWQRLFKNLQEANIKSLISLGVGLVTMLVVLILNKTNNNNPDPSFAWNLIFLLISRPLYILGFVAAVVPLLVGNKGLRGITKILSHKYWIPYSRLTYGVFLCNTILMQFRVFNLQHGDWVQQFNLNLLFMSFLTLSFLFSTFTYLVVEAPMACLLNTFFVKHGKQSQNSIFFHS